MGRGIFFGVLLLAVGLAFGSGGKASAQDYNHTITVYATVVEQRAVYVDASGNIYKIAGNTTRNITPQVYNGDNKLTNMTDSIMRQYQTFLDQYNGQLAAGRVYNVNQLVVQTVADDRSIQLDTAGLTLGSGQSD